MAGGLGQVNGGRATPEVIWFLITLKDAEKGWARETWSWDYARNYHKGQGVMEEVMSE